MILGIDPGASGAVAVLDGGKLVAVYDMPTTQLVINKRKKKRVNARLLFEAVNFYDIDQVFLESVTAMPGQGVSSMFAFGQATGIVEGVVATITENVVTVRPQAWKKHFGVGSDKDRARELAMERWPDHAQLFKRKKDDGRAEAALIGLWGYECSRK